MDLKTLGSFEVNTLGSSDGHMDGIVLIDGITDDRRVGMTLKDGTVLVDGVVLTDGNTLTDGTALTVGYTLTDGTILADDTCNNKEEKG